MSSVKPTPSPLRQFFKVNNPNPELFFFFLLNLFLFSLFISIDPFSTLIVEIYI